MEPHWINICERQPELGQEVQVLVVKEDNSAADIEYGSAKRAAGGWSFNEPPPYTKVVAWLESDRTLSRRELSDVDKGSIRF